MPKREDYVAYMTELAKKAGFTDEQAKPLLEALNNETFREGFVPRPNYSSDLDSAVKRAKDEATASAKAFYDDWFAREGKPAYDRALAATEALGKYKQLYGDLDGTPSPLPAGGGNGTNGTLTKEQVQEMLNQGLAAAMTPIVNMQKTAMKIATQHYATFNEVLDPDDLEKFARDKGLTDVGIAYKEYVSPRLQERQNKEFEEKLKKAREEGAKEERSRLNVPANYAPREYVNPFLKPRDANAPADAGRSAFFEGWDEAANKK